MTVALATGETMTRMFELIRQLANDRATDVLGNAIEAPRFTNGMIVDQLNFKLKWMYNEAGFEHSGETLTAADLTYTPDAADGMDIPSASVPLDSPIALVEDIGDPRFRRTIRKVGPTEIEFYQSDTVPQGALGLGVSVYTLTAAASGRGLRIRIRPSPTSHAIRLWYVAGAFITDGTAGDVIPFSTRFPELLAVGTAVNLLGVDADTTLLQRLQRCEAQFSRFASRMADNDSIRMEYPHL